MLHWYFVLIHYMGGLFCYATDIHNAAHQPVLTVEAGSTVHDFVTVSGQPGSPNPTGTVTVNWFLNGTCAGSPRRARTRR